MSGVDLVVLGASFGYLIAQVEVAVGEVRRARRDAAARVAAARQAARARVDAAQARVDDARRRCG